MPIKLDQVKGDSKKLAALIKFMQGEHNDENIMFVCDKGNPEALYLKYIKRGTAKEVNLPAAVSNPLHALASVKNWKGMEPGIKVAKENIVKLINSDIMPRFEKSPAWKAVSG
jgi:hypothetical protein